MAKVYVGTFWKYNNGDLSGRWVDLEDFEDQEEFEEHCRKIHSDEVDPELMFQDYEDFPEQFYSEGWLDPRLWDWLALDKDDREVVEAYFRSIGDTRDEVSHMVGCVVGRASSMTEYAEESMRESHSEQLAQLSDIIERNINWQAIGEELRQYYTFDEESGIVFGQ